jgi:hypothetical protein
VSTPSKPKKKKNEQKKLGSPVNLVAKKKKKYPFGHDGHPNV